MAFFVLFHLFLVPWLGQYLARKSPQDNPKMTPRRHQKESKMIPIDPCMTPTRPQLDQKIKPKLIQNDSKEYPGDSRWLRDGPRWPQNDSKWIQDGTRRQVPNLPPGPNKYIRYWKTMVSGIQRPAGSHFQAGGDERVSDRVSDMGMSGARYFSKNNGRAEAVSNKPYFRKGSFQINPIFVRAIFKTTLFSCKHFSSQPFFRAGSFQFNPIFVQAVFE